MAKRITGLCIVLFIIAAYGLAIGAQMDAALSNDSSNSADDLFLVETDVVPEVV